jgi:hypothetical protein
VASNVAGWKIPELNGGLSLRKSSNQIDYLQLQKPTDSQYGITTITINHESDLLTMAHLGVTNGTPKITP